MKKLFSIVLMLLSFSLFALATPKENQSFEKAKVSQSAVTPCQDFSFAEMQLSPLDVFASDRLAIEYISEKTSKGFLKVEDKPPVNISTGVLTNNQEKEDFSNYQNNSYLQGNFLSR